MRPIVNVRFSSPRCTPMNRSKTMTSATREILVGLLRPALEGRKTAAVIDSSLQRQFPSAISCQYLLLSTKCIGVTGGNVLAGVAVQRD